MPQRCPRCRAETRWSDDAWAPLPASASARAPTLRLAAVLDNIRSLRNVGSIFRTADGARLEHLHLAGVTPTPEHPKLAKTALGAERSVPWTAHRDGITAARAVLDEGFDLWALEGGREAESLFEVALIAENREGPLAVVIGHEVAGVDPRILQLCRRRVFLPMQGIKESLNVSVAFGIAIYTLLHAHPKSPPCSVDRDP